MWVCATWAPATFGRCSTCCDHDFFGPVSSVVGSPHVRFFGRVVNIVVLKYTASSKRILGDPESMATPRPVRTRIRHARQCSKNVGIQCGLLKNTTVPPDLTPKGVIIHWVKPNEYTKILGVPFWMDGEEAPFWESLYHKIKTKLASFMAPTLHAYNHRPRNARQLYDLLQTTLLDTNHGGPRVVPPCNRERCQSFALGKRHRV